MKEAIKNPLIITNGKTTMYWNDVLKEYHGHKSTGKYRCKCIGYSYEELIKKGYHE